MIVQAVQVVRVRRVCFGEPIPGELRNQPHTPRGAAAFLRWFCPDLTQAEALALTVHCRGKPWRARATYTGALAHLGALRGQPVEMVPWDPVAGICRGTAVQITTGENQGRHGRVVHDEIRPVGDLLRDAVLVELAGEGPERAWIPLDELTRAEAPLASDNRALSDTTSGHRTAVAERGGAGGGLSPKPVAELAGPGDHFRCIPFSAVITARTCVARQQQALIPHAYKYGVPLKDFARCKGCVHGVAVRERLDACGS